MGDKSGDPPIQPLDYVGGVTVVDIGDLRIARGMSRRPHTICTHRHLRYDGQERRVWCADCETTIDGFDAFRILVERYDDACKTISAREKTVKEIETFQVRGRAAKALESAWRSRTMLPVCPHCRNGLFPEDFANGVDGHVSREFAEARRQKKV